MPLYIYYSKPSLALTDTRTELTGGPIAYLACMHIKPKLFSGIKARFICTRIESASYLRLYTDI